MHELSIAMSLVEAACREARANGAHSVRRVQVVLGALSGIEPDALCFCFPIAAQETLCAAAELELRVVPASGRCQHCGQHSDVTDLLAPCPACGSWPLVVEGGREMLLESLEVA